MFKAFRSRFEIWRICRDLCCGILLLLCLGNRFAFGQSSAGSIAGSVIDPQGASVAGVTVKLIDKERGTSSEASSNETGHYQFTNVQPGSYLIQADASGFKRLERSDIALQVNQNLTLPLQLTVGDVSEVVEVSSASPQVDTVSGSVKEVVDQRRITELPLNGRNVLQFQQLVNGSVYTGSGDQGGNTPAFQINGGTSFTNSYSLDGGEHQDSFFNSAITFPNPDALQEFSVQTSSYGAEYGRNRGAVVNAVTRSGTNGFHGTLFEFARNSEFDARDFFAVGVPAFRRNQFGATLGGPIKKNKAFFFFSWESTRQGGSPSSSTFTTFSSAQRGGDFSSSSSPVIDPQTGSQFPGNIIPQNRLSTPALRFLNTYVPLPNSAGNLFSSASRTYFNEDQFIGKYDQELTSKDRFFVRYLWNKDSAATNPGSFTTWFQNQEFPRQSITANYNHSFNPTSINAFTATFNRVGLISQVQPNFNWQSLGANIPQGIAGAKGWAVVYVAGYFYATNGVPWDVRRNTFDFNDGVTLVRGRHTFKTGFQATRYQTNQLAEWFSASSTYFLGQFTGNPGADFLLGNIDTIRQGSSLSNHLRQTLWGLYISDDFRVNPRLTLNLGVRYEPYLGFRELNNEVAGFRAGQQSGLYPSAPRGLLFQGDPGISDTVVPADLNNFAPRVGFAWDVLGNQKLAVRGGYGVFYDAIAGIRLNRFPYNQPFMLDQTLNSRQLSDPYNGQSPFPYQAPTTAAQRSAFQFITPANVTSANENLVTPYTQQWNLTVEAQLPSKLVLSTGYVGSKSSKLFVSRNINPALYTTGASTANIQARRIYPQFGTIEDDATVGYSQYHSLQVLVRRTLSSRLTFSSAYTFSKNIGYTGSQMEGDNGTRDALNTKLDKGILAFDATHVWSTSLTWNLPALQNRNVFLQQLFGGWELSTVTQVQSGFPFTVRSGSNNSLNGQGLDTADLVGDPFLTSGSRAERLAKWFNTAAFATNARGTVGNVGINTLRGPGLWTTDLGLYKNFSILERAKLQFRTQAYNAFNNPNFGQPVSTVTASNFGRITSTTTNPRVLELSLKLLF